MDNGNVKINYATTQSTTDKVNQDAETSLKETVNTAYQKMYALLALSAGDAVDKIKEQLLKDQELAVKAADLYQQLAALIQKAADEFQNLDNQKSSSQVNISTHRQVMGGVK